MKSNDEIGVLENAAQATGLGATESVCLAPVDSTRGAGTAARLKIFIRGAVQGVGFRPFVFRLAQELSLTGWVGNSPQGVSVEVQGPRAQLKKFLQRLKTENPPRSSIQSLESAWLDAAGYKNFEIRRSENAGNKSALVLPDIVTCPDCRCEIFDPANRRYLYPFANCTHCGPRFSIIEALPYDRANTSMKHFSMCPACRREYHDPCDRRFHAQPNACPVCGPHLELWNPAGKKRFERHPALLAAARAIRCGKIVAVKGLGGFHLMADASNEKAVARLRARKHREEKPFALLFPGLVSVKTVCEVSSLEESLLRSPEAPIVLLKRIAGRPSSLAPSVAPGNPNFGVMLPSNPLHELLMAELGFPVIATSGNLSDEPICTDEFEVLERLAGIADLFLVHNRPIVRHIDDSIVRVALGREMILRRARGYAPLPIQLRGEKSEIVLAVGAHLKNSVALAVGENVFISQHIGDLETEQADAAFGRVIADFQKLYAAKPEIVAADLHPDYLSTQFAVKTGPRCLYVQHHVAHVLSCIAENEMTLPALGVAWDGTGLGTDGTIWGGEFFLVDEQKTERIAHLRQFPLPGGDAAAREPRRAALGLLFEMFGHAAFEQTHLPPLQEWGAKDLCAFERMLQRKTHAPLTSSAGRLFDAVASLIGLRQRMRFEGQAAMELEFAIGGFETTKAYEWRTMDGGLPQEPETRNPKPETRSPRPETQSSKPKTRNSKLILDWQPMIEAILADVKNGIPAGKISAKFHNTLAEAVVKVAKHIRHEKSRAAACERIALSGGCFQNRYLLERTVTRLRAEHFQPFWHRSVPPNDGGLALGQVAAALRARPET